MQTYTKEQLINAMTKVNQKVLDNPELFDERRDLSPVEKATEQIDYLIEIIEIGVAL